MADWPLAQQISKTATYTCTTLSSGSPNVKGAWVELISAMPFDGYIELIARPKYTYDALFDIAIGASESETVILSNVLFGGSSSFGWELSSSICLPFIIPAGTRIAARSQNTSIQYGLYITACVYRPQGFHGVMPLPVFDTYGADTSDSGGTACDPGASANTWGGYAQISASLTNSIRGFFLGVGPRENSSPSSASWYVSIAVGAAGSEVDIVEEQRFFLYDINDVLNPRWSPIFWTPIAAGTRISVKAKCTITDATDRLIDVVLYGVR